jgi:hypothetical protein
MLEKRSRRVRVRVGEENERRKKKRRHWESKNTCQYSWKPCVFVLMLFPMLWLPRLTATTSNRNSTLSHKQSGTQLLGTFYFMMNK